MSDLKQVNVEYFTIPGTEVKIPAVGYGTGTKAQWSKKGREESIRHTLHLPLAEDVALAIKRGFRHIDTAETYTTHIEVAHGIKLADVPRDQLFITDKFSPGFKSKARNIVVKAHTSGPYESIKVALKELETEYIDLYLIHSQFFHDELTGNLSITDAWKQLERAQKEGLVRNIGLSNFDKENISEILKIAEIKPKVLQIEFHPYLPNQSEGIIEFAKQNDILVEAYGPLTPLFRAKEGPLAQVLPKLTEKYGKTEGQILLRSVYEQGILPLTTSSNEQRIDDALDIFSFKLDKEDLDLIKKTGSEFKFRGFFKTFDGEED
ncbi:hypothetical protein WICMUC_005358 [Wickerhamomyces mucosus]|uniref:NADP-dependent oxidoreductase domain-containing protein n=1 Tax=Wickerhamomyces mucosus TaxID=1378264 RepID=A0A9P8T6I8_9ASCO|nr:hypothetical protein WICMUC_005358 [Wickerhamomyces mucosus]